MSFLLILAKHFLCKVRSRSCKKFILREIFYYFRLQRIGYVNL